MGKKKTKPVRIEDKTETNLILKENFSLAKKDVEILVNDLDPWKQDFLLDWLNSGSISTDGLDTNLTDVSVALKTDKKFNKSYNQIRKILDRVELMKLEKVSESNALAPKNMVERIFRLKSLDRDRYADRGKNIGANVQVNIAFGDGVVGYSNPPSRENNSDNSDGKISKGMKEMVRNI